MERKMKLGIIVVVIVVIAAIILFFSKGVFTGNAVRGTEGYNEFVSCLNEEGFVLYGFNGNSFVDAQLGMFEEAAKNVSYVDCAVYRCEGTIVYPSWKVKDRIVTGGLSLGMLSSLSGCEL